MEERLLYTSNEDLDIIQVCSILESNQIPFIKKEDGSGQYMNVTIKEENEEEYSKNIKTSHTMKGILVFCCIGFPAIVLLILIICLILGII